ncbi:DUF805 domain-containing protein [Paenarthrobacter sp. TAF1]|uniref:DUF805 domain-containing protein n=1 Tax=Paenarthrobacter sp. TAF1 TaxID=3233067 RepID=UPI0003812373
MPLYGVTPFQAVARFFLKFAVFSGRASRSEFWWWVLAQTVVFNILRFIQWADTTDSGLMGPVAAVASFLVWSMPSVFLFPNIALMVWRLHDVNESGWFGLFVLIPVLGLIPVLFMNAKKSDPRGQRFDVRVASTQNQQQPVN